MSEQDWKARLVAGIKASGKSDREISLAAGRGAGYIHSLLKEGKDPTIGHLKAVCEAANISIYYVLGGFDLTPEREEFLRLLEGVNREAREGVLNLLRLGRPSDTQSPPASSKGTPARTRR